VSTADIQRILVGDAPPAFLLEVLLRTLAVYLAFVVVVRWLGKRMAGQLTFVEMAIMLALGAIISPAMQVPERGVLIGIFILFCILAFQRLTTILCFRSDKIHSAVQGTVSCLVEDGVIKLNKLQESRVTKQQLFAVLRSSEVYNLGDIERVYLEPYGDFSIYKFDNSRPGLSTLPPGFSSEKIREEGASNSCVNCGYTNKNHYDTCPVCGDDHWIKSITANERKQDSSG
jgi:uncharacterized membrane protein YcaP (DUF421 family)